MTTSPCPHGSEMEVVELPHPDAHLATAVALFPGVRLRALQIVWSDDRGHWPWDVGFRSNRGGQAGARSAVERVVSRAGQRARG